MIHVILNNVTFGVSELKLKKWRLDNSNLYTRQFSSYYIQTTLGLVTTTLEPYNSLGTYISALDDIQGIHTCFRISASNRATSAELGACKPFEVAALASFIP